MAEFIARMFTPSNSDGSGMVSPSPGPAPAAPKPKKAAEKGAIAKTRSRFGGIAKKRKEEESTKKTLLGG